MITGKCVFFCCPFQSDPDVAAIEYVTRVLYFPLLPVRSSTGEMIHVYCACLPPPHFITYYKRYVGTSKDCPDF